METQRLSLMTFPMDVDILNQTMSIRDVLQLARQAGIPTVDVMNVQEEQLEEYGDAIRQTGVRVYTYIMQTSFLGSRRRYRRAVARQLKIAEALGAKYLMIVPYGSPDGYRAEALGREKVKQRMIEGFRHTVASAKKYGIRVCFETTPHALSYLSDAQDCLDVLQSVKGLEFVFDTANMLPSGGDPQDAYEKLKGRISHVHLKDVVLLPWERLPKHAEYTPDGKLMAAVVWGEGLIPIQSIYQKMLADGYKGRFAIEYVHPEYGSDLTAHISQLNRFLQSAQRQSPVSFN